MPMVDDITKSIPYLDRRCSYADFYTKFLYQNFPCLFTDDHTNSWPARSKWNKGDSINIDAILKPFLGQELCVANCEEFEFGTHPTLTMSTESYLSYWKSFSKCDDMKLLYLKDWHYFRGRSFNEFYKLPAFFSSDWLNEFSDFRTDCNDDFRFVYIGPKGTWTPLHTDVYCSYSWSANIIGLKRWWIFPPGEEKKLVDLNGGVLPPDIRGFKLATPGSDPALPQCYIFDQRPGEMFFVPAGWFHQVLNLTDCVSINNNWLNACNIGLVWRHLQSQLQEVKKSCCDVKSTPGWDEACQACLKSWEGWNYEEFFLLLKYILLSRWLSKDWQELRAFLPKASKMLDCKDDELSSSMPLRILDEQVETVLSSTAKDDPHFVEWLIEAPKKEDVCWMKLFLDDANISRGVREHDLIQVARTIQSMLMDIDVQYLGLHSRGSAAWIWKVLIGNQS
ncbi:hypothetical protein Aperf_G00000091761 [Anoplocephala perfoliata]